MIHKSVWVLPSVFLLWTFGGIFADGDVPDKLDLSTLGDEGSYSIPSPNEILSASHRKGLVIETKDSYTLFKTDVKKLASASRVEAAFVLGRMFSVAGLSYSKISNENILRLAEKLYDGTKSLDLPSSMEREISNKYKRFLNNPQLDRAELLTSFTEARSTLVFLLKNSEKIPKKDRDSVQAISASLEMGLWLQSLYLAGIQVDSDKKRKAFLEIFLIKDILNYFSSNIDTVLKEQKMSPFFRILKNINSTCLRSAEDNKLDKGELEHILIELSIVIY